MPNLVKLTSVLAILLPLKSFANAESGNAYVGQIAPSQPSAYVGQLPADARPPLRRQAVAAPRATRQAAPAASAAPQPPLRAIDQLPHVRDGVRIVQN